MKRFKYLVKEYYLNSFPSSYEGNSDIYMSRKYNKFKKI